MNDKLPKSTRQTISLFEDFVRRKEIIDFITHWRKILNLPKDGLGFTEMDAKHLTNLPRTVPYTIYTPKRARVLFPEDLKKDQTFFTLMCRYIVDKQGIPGHYVPTLLRYYIIFNKVIEIPLPEIRHGDDLLTLEYIPQLSEYAVANSKLVKDVYEYLRVKRKNYPIVLFINPEVTMRQVQDFLAKNLNFIKKYSKRKKPVFSIYRRKKQSILKRNDYIFEHKNLPGKELMRRLKEEFPDLPAIDYGHIAKIISIEKRRRENK